MPSMRHCATAGWKCRLQGRVGGNRFLDARVVILKRSLRTARGESSPAFLCCDVQRCGSHAEEKGQGADCLRETYAYFSVP